MRQLSALFLALVYAVLTLGTGMQLHLCGDAGHTSLVYQLDLEEGCDATISGDHSCCNSKKSTNKDHDDDCCSDVKIFLAEDIKGVVFSFPDFTEYSVSDYFTTDYSFLLPEEDHEILSNFSEEPPIKQELPLYLKNCSLVFYA